MRKKIKSVLALILVFSMLFGDAASLLLFRAEALDVDGMRIDEVRYIKKHQGFNVSGGSLIVMGAFLKPDTFYFDVAGEPQKLGTLSASSGPSVLVFQLSDKEVNKFSGKIYAGSRPITLIHPDMPYVSGANKDSVNQDKNESITIYGANLNSIDNTKFTATYGKGIAQRKIVDTPPANKDSHNFTPVSPAEKGFQDIVLKYLDQVSDPRVEINYTYSNAFRIIEDLNLAPIQMYPNSASRGDYITLSSDGFSSADKYRVYFLDLNDGDFAFEDYKMSPDVVLSQDEKRLSVQIPTSKELELGTKRVVVTKVSNSEIVARFNLTEEFNLIDAKFQPLITKINPKSGSDEGTSVQIIGRNLISPTISGLNSPTNLVEVESATPENENMTMKVTYKENNLTFRGEPVTDLSRKIKVTIAKPAKFNLKPDGTVQYMQVGADDNLFVTTAVIDEVGTDPVKDVLIEIETVIVAGGKTYVFNQSALETDAFTFLESSIEPEITAVFPELIQIKSDKKLKERTLISIEGGNFLVNKYTDENGLLKINYPVIQVQKGTNLGSGEYIIKIDPNDKTGTAKGTIYNPFGQVLKDGNGRPLPVEMYVLDSQGKLVDGSKGNEIGKRIVVYLPKEMMIEDAGRRHLQVINPKRGSDDYGKSLVAKDMLDFVQANDTPVISSVEPNIVTINSATEVLVKGSNFQEGVKVLIDGIEVQGLVRETDKQGSGMTLKFKSPPGRVGKTQLAVLNPLGGIATRDFFFIKSLGQDPVLTSIAPNKGTTDTLVVAQGDNFFKPDPATETAEGLDIYRLIGTRVYLDGKDVNNYNKNALGDIELRDYARPAVEPLLKIKNGQVAFTDYKDNVYVTNVAGDVIYILTTDNNGNPMLFDGHKARYIFKLKGGNIFAYDEEGREVGSASINSTDIDVTGGEHFKVYMDNSLLGAKLDVNKKLEPYLADYWKAVLLYDQTGREFYTLSHDLDGKIKLTNGKNSTYVIGTAGSSVANPDFKARDLSGNSFDVEVINEGLKIASLGLTLKMKTAYVVEDGRITGKRAFVNTKNEIFFDVPALDSGSGLKDVEVINPDTKSDKLPLSFYYYHLPSTRPIISHIVPNRGSVEGGYIVRIHGRDFKDSTEVYFGGIKVPDEDKYVDTGGSSMEVKVPKYPLDLNITFGIGELTVPVVVVNIDGASSQLPKGFTYVKPASTPRIKRLILDSGSSNGGEVVEIIGEDFRFFEPYLNLGGSSAYEEGIDTFTNFNNHLPISPKWDDLLLSERFVGPNKDIDLWEPKPFPAGANYYGYEQYYDSPILPSVYFGTRKAYIVEFDRDYIKVISPVGKTGPADVVVMNNDSGVSNKVVYTYTSSDPTITYINPDSGSRAGFDLRSLVGKGFNKYRIDAYTNDDDTKISKDVKDLDALIRFGNLSNEEVKIGQKNDGRINANHAVVNIEGGLRVSYDGSRQKLDVSLEEGGIVYTRTFHAYDGRDVLFPAGMLKKGADYYVPFGYKYDKKTVYNKENDYELIRVRVDRNDKRLIVERGYAPRTILKSEGQIDVRTPSYYTIGTVDVTLFNPDGGFAKTAYTYTNPASHPVIESAKPMDLIAPHTVENESNEEIRIVQASVQGGTRVEIVARDLREGAKLYFGTKEVKIIEVLHDDVQNIQTLIAIVPEGTNADISEKLPIIIINKDGGTAISNDRRTLGSDKRLLYFVYRKPLSLPEIKEIVPNKTSQYGGNSIEIRGSDFRKDLKLILGSKGGVPVIPGLVDDLGRFIRFTVPTGLTPGKKDVQIVNTDFGTATVPGGLEIISYPILDSKVKDSKGIVEVSVVSTEGTDTITLTGKNFMQNAKVYFGGKRTLKSAEATQGVEGFYRDDRYYLLSSAIEAKKVEFVDENTLRVETPQISKESEYTITVINPDGGLSEDKLSLRFSLPKPSATNKLKAEVVDKKYIKLYDYRMPNVENFTFYAYIGPKTAYQLRRDKYVDFKALGTSTLEPYKITRLDGFTKLKKNEYAHFAVRNSNHYGYSDWSNIATLSYKDIKDVKNLGDNSEHVEIGIGPKEATRLDVKGNKAEYLLTDRAVSGDVALTLGSAETENIREYSFLIPRNQVKNYKGSLRLNSPVAYGTFRPMDFNNALFNAYATTVGARGRLDFSYEENMDSSAAKSRIPARFKAVSPVFTVGMKSELGATSKDISPISRGFRLGLKLDSPYLTEKAGPVYVYRYDEKSLNWLPHKAWAEKRLLKLDVTQSGYYIVVQSR